MKHSYINPKKIQDFTLPEYDDVISDLKSLELTNIVDEEWVYEELGWLLHDDIEKHFANYKGYVEKGMDLRVLMELRKSAILRVATEDFLIGHCNLSTPQEIKQYRAKYLEQVFEDYRDDDWQAFFVIRLFLNREEREFFEIDFDARGWLLDTPSDYCITNYLYDALNHRINNVNNKHPIDLMRLIKLNNGWEGWEDPRLEELGYP